MLLNIEMHCVIMFLSSCGILRVYNSKRKDFLQFGKIKQTRGPCFSSNPLLNPMTPPPPSPRHCIKICTYIRKETQPCPFKMSQTSIELQASICRDIWSRRSGFYCCFIKLIIILSFICYSTFSNSYKS